MKRKRFILWLTAFIILIILAACSNKRELAEQHYQAGREFASNNRPDSALAEYKLAIAAFPKHIEVNTSYQNLLRYEFYREDDVFEEYKAKIEKHPKDPVYRYLYARLEDDPDKMKEEAEVIIEMDPAFYYGHHLLGMAYYRIGYDDDAIDAFQKAIEIDPMKVDALYYMAIIHNNNSEYDEAIDVYKKIIALDSTRVNYYVSIWRIEYSRAEDKETIKERILNDIDATIEKYPDNLSLLSSIRYLYRTLGETDLAKRTEERLMTLDETGQYAQMAAYNQIYQNRDNKARVQAAEEFLEKFPDASFRKYVYSALFRFVQEESDYKTEEIEAIGQRWINEYPDDASPYNSIAWNFYLKNPKFYEKAVEYAKKGAELAPRRMKGNNLDTYGWALVKTGRYAEAVDVMLEVDSLYTEPNWEVKYHVGAAYHGLGNMEKTIEYLVQSLALRENDEARDLFYEAYKKKHGSRKGANDFLYKEILAFSAVKEPFAAPDFTLTSLTGQEVTLSQHIGKVILANFWKPG